MVPELYTPEETAKYLQVGYRKVLDLIHLKKLGAYKIGKKYMIPIHEIQLEICAISVIIINIYNI